MPDHTISVVNHSGRKQKYVIIPAPPMMTLGSENKKHEGGCLVWHAKELDTDNKEPWETSTTYQLYGWVGTTAEKPGFGVKVTSIDVNEADPATPTTPASTFGLTKNETGDPVMTVKEKTAPMDMVRFDFGGDLSPSDGKYIVYGMAKGNRLPDGTVGKRPFAYYPAPTDTNSVQFAVMAPVIQLWVCAYDAEEGEIVDYTDAIQTAGMLRFLNTDGALRANVEHREDGRIVITYE
ncbi:hypothetical protein BO85DRAFT_504082 [Aspergillus piperis CBS 112811]|uniref:Uncharacterized protein n=1 Tax=Aspergillus piperis CBS 112811 TaxID=1448313 RepID=A0A8G1QUY9_9EURO|nr:hypothetical protein BO85DRAFT_504082 [Aspergillus piperis CBS 112811]RAH53446.1 hypothetical protein BO85DRAFT_504082 [Aspergillus piperis CBS 112811]